MPDIVIVAASARLFPGLSKASVTERILGRPTAGHALTGARDLDCPTTLLIADHDILGDTAAQLRTAHQRCSTLELAPDCTPAAGLRAALTEHGPRHGTALVLPADAPLLTDVSLRTLLDAHARSRAAATILAAAPEATAHATVYAFDLALLCAALEKLAADGSRETAVLPEVERVLREERLQVERVLPGSGCEALRCTSPLDLSVARGLLRARINKEWIERGVKIIDPESTQIDAEVRLEPGAVIEPRVILRGSTVVETGAVVGPEATLADTIVRAGAGVVSAHAVGAVIGPGAQVGPFAYLRPGTVLGERTKVGTFVEVKQAEIAEGTQIAHLAYVGNAIVGRDVNIGAGTTFSLYDGVRKHETVVGDAAFIGCQTSLVAPVRIGPGAFTGAGSVITDDVPPGALAIARTAQHNVEAWVARHRPGTRWAAAAGGAEAPEETAAEGDDHV